MSSSEEQLFNNKANMGSQVMIVMAIAFGPLSVGLAKGYTSPALASLQGYTSTTSVTYASQTSVPNASLEEEIAVTSDLRITSQEASWVASLSLLGALVGGLLSSQVLKFGRRMSLLAVSLPFSAFWLLTVFATSVEMIYATAFLAGVCSAIVNLVSQVYISEISRPELRGRLSACLKIFSHMGLMLSYLMGVWLDWRQLALVCAAAPLMMFVTVHYTPETPSYLVYSGQLTKAEQSLQWLKGGVSDVSAEMELLQINIHRMKEQGNGCKSVLVPQLVKPVLLTSALMFFNRFSGASAFNFYAVTIFSQVFGDLNPHLVAVVMAAVQLLSSVFSGILSDKLGRKPLLLIAGLTMAVTLSGFGLYAYVYTDVKSAGDGDGTLDWLPLILILVFECACSVGIHPISWLMVGELFPLEYRAAGTSLTTSVGYAFAFLGVKTFVDFNDAMGLHGTLWTYSAISVLGCWFSFVFIPETREQPLDEMQDRECEENLKV